MERKDPQRKQTAVKEYWTVWIKGDQLAPGFNQASLEQINVDLINPNLPRFRCRTCEKEWTPKVKVTHVPANKEYRTEAALYKSLPIGWWRCPSGCSAKAARRLQRQRAARPTILFDTARWESGISPEGIFTYTLMTTSRYPHGVEQASQWHLQVQCPCGWASSCFEVPIVCPPNRCRDGTQVMTIVTKAWVSFREALQTPALMFAGHETLYTEAQKVKEG